MSRDPWNRMPLMELTTQKAGLCNVILNAWWWIDKDDNVFFYRRTSPQCNSSREVAMKTKTHPDMAQLVQLPFASFKINPHDYC